MQKAGKRKKWTVWKSADRRDVKRGKTKGITSDRKKENPELNLIQIAPRCSSKERLPINISFQNSLVAMVILKGIPKSIMLCKFTLTTANQQAKVNQLHPVNEII